MFLSFLIFKGAQNKVLILRWYVHQTISSPFSWLELKEVKMKSHGLEWFPEALIPSVSDILYNILIFWEKTTVESLL